MAEASLSQFQRQAIWETHSKRCAYCREPVRYSNLQIDHIIPESLLSTPELLSEKLSDLGRAASFNMQGYENLVPACFTCNNRKRATLFPDGRLTIELEVVARLKPLVEAKVARLHQQEQVDTVRIFIANALQSGKVTEQDLATVIGAANADIGQFKLSEQSMLFPGLPTRSLRRDAIELYLDDPIILPEPIERGLRLVNDNDQEVYVNTLRSYKERTATGYYAFSNYEMGIAATVFERPITILSLLARATAADLSFIDDPRLGVADIALMPATLLFNVRDMIEDETAVLELPDLEGRTIQDLVTSGEAKISQVGTDILSIETEEDHTLLFEMMRADFNNDGIQDVLVYWSGGPKGGTYRAVSSIILTRTAHDALFTAIKIDDIQSARG